MCERHDVLSADQLAQAYNKAAELVDEPPMPADDALAMWTGSRDYAAHYLLGISIALHLSMDELAEIFPVEQETQQAAVLEAISELSAASREHD